MVDIITRLVEERQVGDVFGLTLLYGKERIICHGQHNELMESNALSQRLHLWEATEGSVLILTKS